MTALPPYHCSIPSRPLIRVAAILLALFTGMACAERLDVGLFSRGSLDAWETESFVGHTRYRLEADPAHGSVLRANSQASASGLFRRISPDLARTPWLHWSWKVDSLLGNADERSKDGDDYPARIYVVFSGGLLFWNTRAINYVWSGNQAVGTEWPNAYTANARMIAVQSGAEHLGQWQKEVRDVRADYRRLFAEEPGRVSAVALMTDTDNTGRSVQAWYGDIWFSSQP